MNSCFEDDGGDRVQAVEFEVKDQPTIVFIDNSACIKQISSRFIKADKTKYISPHIFSYTQDLIEKRQLEIIKVESEHKIADMLIKAFPTYKPMKLIYAAGIRSLQELTSPDN